MIAYLQPISRGRVSAVRGVNVDGVLRTLVTRDLVQEVDRDAETGAMLFGTTGHFLERLGLSGLDDLPPIAPLLPDAATLEAELLRASQPSLVESVEAEADEPVETPADGASIPLVELVETPDAGLCEVPTSSTSEGASPTTEGRDSADEETTR